MFFRANYMQNPNVRTPVGTEQPNANPHDINNLPQNQMVFSMNVRNNIPLNTPVKEVKKEEPPKKKAMFWGAPTWFFLHTIAHKIKDESFPLVRKELLGIILTICGNLPCPECSTHAKDYLNKKNFNAIQTKQQLKDVLFHFHNMVNERKHFSKFEYDQLDAKYSGAILVNIFNHFIRHYTNGTGNSHMIADIFYRTKIAENIKRWLDTNNQYFE